MSFAANNHPGSTSPQTRRGLDWMNFFLADVRDGVGPYLAIFLAASHNWNASDIGLVMGAMGLATGVSQIFAGQWMDSTNNKRGLVAVASAVIGAACIIMAMVPSFWVILLCQIAIGASAALIIPGISALTLGTTGYKTYARRQGRNEVFNHAGNVVAAVMAGVVGHFLARELIFWVVALWSVFSMLSVYMIRSDDIDLAVARGANRVDGQIQVSSFATLLQDKRLGILALVILLFHFGNAAMLPLVGQELTANAQGQGASLWMSACIIGAQLVMIPVAAYTGKYAEQVGRKPVFLIALVVLPIRGVLFSLGDDPLYLLAVQLLDGISAGIFGVLWVLMVADLTKGTGHYGITLGVLNTAHMIGFFLSQTTSGWVVDHFDSYASGFLYLSAVAGVALMLFAWAMPETQNVNKAERGD